MGGLQPPRPCDGDGDDAGHPHPDVDGVRREGIEPFGLASCLAGIGRP